MTRVEGLPFLSSKQKYLQGKTLVVTGASRGIGRAIALRAAIDGANIAILAKTTVPHPKLPGTIFSVAKEIELLGGRALPLAVDIRDEGSVREAMEQTVAAFGGIDIVVNNASAISLTGTLDTEMRRYDLMHDINVRGSYCVARMALPYLLKSPNPHILSLSPPISLKHQWWAGHPAYTMSKMGMSMVTVGLAAEFSGKVACNSLWPRTIISTAALQAFAGDQSMQSFTSCVSLAFNASFVVEELHKRSRSAAIVADTAYAILSQPFKAFSYCWSSPLIHPLN